jgi:short-subunit dehydrogenase
MSRQLALVTGASSGIGFSLARELANRGYDVVVASSGDRLSSAALSLWTSGSEVIEINADLATRAGIDDLWKKVGELGRPVDVACLNAA